MELLVSLAILATLIYLCTCLTISVTLLINMVKQVNPQIDIPNPILEVFNKGKDSFKDNVTNTPLERFKPDFKKPVSVSFEDKYEEKQTY